MFAFHQSDRTADAVLCRLRARAGREQVQQDAPERAPPNLLDDLVGAQQKCFRNCQAERLGGFKIDDKLEDGRLLDR